MEKKLKPIGQLFSQSFDFYKSKFKILTKISAVYFLAWLLASPFIGIGVALNYKFIFTGTGFNFMSFLVSLLFFLVGILFAIALGFWVYTSLFFAVKDANNEDKLKKVMMDAKDKIASFSWVSFLIVLFVFLGFVLLIVPGIIFSVWTSQAIFILVYENVKGIDALKKSRELVRGYWWPIFGRFLLMMLLNAIVSSIKFLSLGGIISVLFLTPFNVVYMTNLYQDLKKVKSQAA